MLLFNNYLYYSLLLTLHDGYYTLATRIETASSHGHIGEFNSQLEDWRSYTERMQNYFIANDIKSESKQRAILLSVCGPRTYKLIRSLLLPQEPKDVSFADIVKQMTDHYQPKPSIIVQRFKFHSRSRKPGESVATYIAELKRLSEDCCFGEFLQEMLRDRIVCGINDPRIQHRLLAEHELTYKSAFELAQSMETADQNTNDLQSVPRNEPHRRQEDFHYTPRALGQSRVQPGQPRFICYRCGGNHKAPDCKHTDTICNSCGKKGHLSKFVELYQLMLKFQETESSDSRPILQQLTLKRTLKPQGLTIWMQAQMKMNTIYSP